MLYSLAKQIGETGFDQEPSIINLIVSICGDNKINLRKDGAVFFKEYLCD
jgi:hypothetical protein